ncbi:hypothetical protein QBC47DRAFT_129025 [Echria macrotheca]|uniref:Uncharacterized protein n=1 Tax=Echria macrotheca TaxID=438768 RepID=A0AAJ0B623_9PEZI|nr:hypothetical protein QBC47DRAFT_129025 [Echria macrotheca]
MRFLHRAHHPTRYTPVTSGHSGRPTPRSSSVPHPELHCDLVLQVYWSSPSTAFPFPASLFMSHLFTHPCVHLSQTDHTRVVGAHSAEKTSSWDMVTLLLRAWLFDGLDATRGNLLTKTPACFCSGRLFGPLVSYRASSYRCRSLLLRAVACAVWLLFLGCGLGDVCLRILPANMLPPPSFDGVWSPHPVSARSTRHGNMHSDPMYRV